ncbi:transcriptional regulator YeiL [Kurthia sibirica]|uniref:Transcriptional regulator YeiL n=1 Tax=Kurthia sibirica TaxID=202750 RepID=A0A2U3AIY0_9BACL|nr:transcriptional regulator YeiL [Kurthia sibirica]PWI24503.1 transcriptional regulator YeiL [Kurthia sibirica]GEK33567.1 transcriptional regulator YeiL [Kurthia sibirica]
MKKLSQKNINDYLQLQPIDRLFSFDIIPYIELHDFERDEYIIKEGRSPDYLYYVISGKAKIYYTQENGKVTLLNFITTGSFIGEIELLQQEHHSKGIQTSSKMRCFAIPVEQTKELLFADARFLRHLSTFLSYKATTLATKYSQGLTFPFEHRLAEFLLLSSDAGYYRERHTEVCEYLGVSYRHLLHVLAQFVTKGLIAKNQRGYQILQPALLRDMATTTHQLDVTPLQLAQSQNKR